MARRGIRNYEANISAQDREVDGELLTSVLMQKLWLIIYENIDKTCMEEQVDDSGSVRHACSL